MSGGNAGTVNPDIQEKAKRIKVVLMDVDGVLTDGKLYYLPGPDGAMAETKGFNSQDGLGFHMCNMVGIVTGVISGRNSQATTERARILKMKYVYQGHLEKIPLYEEILKDAGVDASETAYIGDDFTDVPLIKRAGLGVAVGDAREEVKAHADLITLTPGGCGAVREVMEIILKAQGHWQRCLDKFEITKTVSTPIV